MQNEDTYELDQARIAAEKLRYEKRFGEAVQAVNQAMKQRQAKFEIYMDTNYSLLFKYQVAEDTPDQQAVLAHIDFMIEHFSNGAGGQVQASPNHLPPGTG